MEPIDHDPLRTLAPEAPAIAPRGQHKVGLVTCIGVALTASLVCGVAAGVYSESRLRAALLLRPPILVVVYSGVTAALEMGVSADNLRGPYATYKKEVAEAGDAGFLVVNRAALEEIPDGFILPPPDWVATAGGVTNQMANLPASPAAADASQSTGSGTDLPTMSANTAAGLLRLMLHK